MGLLHENFLVQLIDDQLTHGEELVKTNEINSKLEEK